MKEYFPRLDALRFLAFLVVFLNHSASFLHFPASVHTPGTPAFVYLQDGDVAVGFFFVLSAFLVTYLFEKERAKKRMMALRHFYLRRVLRIWPLYFFVIALIGIVSAFATGLVPYETAFSVKEFGAALVFLTGITRPLFHSSNEMLAILWSISVEEQFYLLWPFVFRFFRKYASITLVGVLLVSMAFRYFHANEFEWREFHVLSGVGYLALGALAGLYANRIREWVVRYARLIVVLSLIGIIATLSVRGFVFSTGMPEWFAAFSAPLFGMCFVGIVLTQAFTGVSTTERSKNKLMATIEYFGTISYGLYVYHLVALTLVLAFLGGIGFSYMSPNSSAFFMIAGVTLSVSIIIASLSYRYIETPFLRLKKKFTNV